MIVREVVICITHSTNKAGCFAATYSLWPSYLPSSIRMGYNNHSLIHSHFSMKWHIKYLVQPEFYKDAKRKDISLNMEPAWNKGQLTIYVIGWFFLLFGIYCIEGRILHIHISVSASGSSFTNIQTVKITFTNI